MANNPYAAPRSRVADSQQQVGEAKFWSFSGRLGRIRYLGYAFAAYFVAVAIILGIMLLSGGLGMATQSSGAGGYAMLLIIPVYIALLVILFMLTIQRCHDFNVTGWLSLLILVPLGGFVFWFVPGTKGTNNYGPPPPPNTAGLIVLVVLGFLIFVVGILAAIAIPAYMGFTQQAQQSQYQQNQSPEDFQQQLQQLQEEMQRQEQQQGGEPQPIQQSPQQ